jgi:hypothetical protein
MEADKLVEPPNYYTDQHIFDIDFHPKEPYIAYSNINGEVVM